MSDGAIYSDNHEEPISSQHLAGLHLLKQLRSHPARVFDKQKAAVHFTGILPMTSYLCGDKNHHRTRMKAAAAALEHEWSKLDESDPRVYVIVDTSWDTKDHMEDVYYLLASHEGRKRLLFGGSDLAFAAPISELWYARDWEGYLRSRDLRPNWFSMPYVASYLLDEAARRPDETCKASSRTHSFFFAGSFGRVGRGSRRTPVLEAMDRRSSSANIVRADGVEEQHHDLHGVAWRYAHNMLTARYCLVPAGDTSTSRRFHDAMSAGCVPVYMGTINDHTLYSIGFTDPDRKSVV